MRLQLAELSLRANGLVVQGGEVLADPVTVGDRGGLVLSPSWATFREAATHAAISAGVTALRAEPNQD
jgi:hypothetical protein